MGESVVAVNNMGPPSPPYHQFYQEIPEELTGEENSIFCGAGKPAHDIPIICNLKLQ